MAYWIAGIDCMNGTAPWSCQIFAPRGHGSGAAPLAELLGSLRPTLTELRGFDVDPAEIGKVLKALRTLGLEVIIQPRGQADPTRRTGKPGEASS